MPHVNIVIPTFNRLKALQRAVESVQAQSYLAWRLTIVDDGSTDQTQSWVTNTLKPKLKKKLHYIKTENSGVSHARNMGIKSRNTEYTALLDSDDQWASDKLQIQVDFLQQNSQLSFVHNDESWIKNDLPFNQKSHHKKSGGHIFEKCVKACVISPSASLFKTSIFSKVGYFDESLVVCEDYDLWLRISKRYEIGFIDKKLTTKHGGHSDQLSFAYKAMDYWRVKSLIKHLGCKTLPNSSQTLLKNTINKKCSILLKGYLKYNNLKNYEEIKNIQSSIA